jgi:hypothetical protein
MAAPRKRVREFTSLAREVQIGDQVRQSATDKWVRVERVEQRFVRIDDHPIEVVHLVYADNGMESWIDQRADDPIEIQRAESTPSEGAAE